MLLLIGTFSIMLGTEFKNTEEPLLVVWESASTKPVTGTNVHTAFR
jgi:hypothetical protein